jgi:hypothetical protein
MKRRGRVMATKNRENQRSGGEHCNAAEYN